MLSAHCSFQLHLDRIAFFILSHASYEKNEELGDFYYSVDLFGIAPNNLTATVACMNAKWSRSWCGGGGGKET